MEGNGHPYSKDQKIPNEINPQKSTLKLNCQMSKTRKILKAGNGKLAWHKGIFKRLQMDFLAKILASQKAVE